MGRFQPSLLARDPAERARFLLALRATGTIRGAAGATGAAVATVNRLRNRDHGFAAACAAVMGDPRTHTLEAGFLARLTDGVERKRIYADGRVETWRDYNDALTFAVLQRLSPDRWGEGAGVAKPPERPQMTRAEFAAAIGMRRRPAPIDPATDYT